MPAESNKHSLQCAIDTSDCGLWVGSMNLLYPLLRYHWYLFYCLFIILFYYILFWINILFRIKRPPKIGQSRLRVTN